MDTIKLLEKIRDDYVNKFDGDPMIRRCCNVMINEFKLRTKQCDIPIVISMLPTKYDELPEILQEELSMKHTHAELVEGEEIVYKEQDVLELLQFVSVGNYL